MLKNKNLRNKILISLLIVILFRIGSIFPVPFVNTDILQMSMESVSTTVFGLFNMMSGGGLSQASIFAMGVSPYINASIIVQLLAVAIPALEQMRKEGMEGTKKLNRLTRYLSIALAILQSLGFYSMLSSWGALTRTGFVPMVIIILAFSTGSVLTMWLGERITESGIGNGISIILASGILSGLPSGIMMLKSIKPYYWSAVIGLIILATLVLIVFMNESEKRIPVQYAKAVPSKYGPQKSHIPLKVNLSGVMPIIFASTILSIPNTIAMFVPSVSNNETWSKILNCFSSTSLVYAGMYFCLIILFNYFYVSIQYDPIEMANNIKQQGGVIPGIRPGKPTSEYIHRAIKKLTFIGAVLLGVIALIPILLNTAFNGYNFYLGGTSLLILVSVSIETVKQMNSLQTLYNYSSF